MRKTRRSAPCSRHGSEPGGTHGAEAGSTKEEQNGCSGQLQATSNLIGVDTARISEFSSFSFAIPESVFRLGISLGFLASLLGWQAPLAGVAAMCLILPINLFFSRRYLAAQKRLARIRDQKLSVTSEVLRGMQQIKFTAGEPRWEGKIHRIREAELRGVWNTFMNDLVLIGCWTLSPITLAAVSLGVSAVVQGQLTPSTAFVSLGVFRALETTLSIIPELTTDLLEARVSATRIENYLSGATMERNFEPASDVTFSGVTAAWTADAKAAAGQFMLRGINAKFPRGELSIISGKTGSGKSMMLAAILGEVEILSGAIHVPPPPAATTARHRYRPVDRPRRPSLRLATALGRPQLYDPRKHPIRAAPRRHPVQPDPRRLRAAVRPRGAPPWCGDRGWPPLGRAAVARRARPRRLLARRDPSPGRRPQRRRRPRRSPPPRQVPEPPAAPAPARHACARARPHPHPGHAQRRALRARRGVLGRARR